MSGRGRKRRALSDIGAVTAHGAGWRARFYIDECNVLGPLRSCKEDAEADLERLRAASSRDELRLAAQRMMPAFASPVSLELCGINVQYPWSRLILAGVKAVEVRKYPLGRYPSFIAEQDLFLIETPGRGSTQDADCAIDVGAPPDKACVIGVVRFSGCFQFADLAEFDLFRDQTRITSGGRYDWLHLGDRPIFGWVVGNTKGVEPMPADSKTMLGWQRPRPLTVSFRAV